MVRYSGALRPFLDRACILSRARPGVKRETVTRVTELHVDGDRPAVRGFAYGPRTGREGRTMTTATTNPPRLTAGPAYAYVVQDSHTGQIVSTYAYTDRGRRAAYRRADRLDARYGAVRYTVGRA
jgi:hypothetical protein